MLTVWAILNEFEQCEDSDVQWLWNVVQSFWPGLTCSQVPKTG